MFDTLCIIDMQYDFHCANLKYVIQGVKKQIFEAKKYNANVIILEYGGRGETRRDIKNEVLDNNLKFIILKKQSDDGSAEIINYTNFKNKTFRLCGVYLEACVLMTAIGLVRKVPSCNVEICKSASNKVVHPIDILCLNRQIKIINEQYKDRIKMV